MYIIVVIEFVVLGRLQA